MNPEVTIDDFQKGRDCALIVMQHVMNTPKTEGEGLVLNVMLKDFFIASLDIFLKENPAWSEIASKISRDVQIHVGKASLN